MRVLHLLRQSRGGMWTAASHLAKSLCERHVDVELIDASTFIPNETGSKIDKSVNLELKQIGAEYDLVHAWGYRAAWACGDTYKDKEAWLYSAYDIPKSTHRLLINHLNTSQAGLCSSRAVYRKLDEALALDLEIMHPGLGPVESEIDRTVCREHFEIDPESLVIGAIGRFVPERGFEALLAALPKAIVEHPNLRLIIAGEGPDEEKLRSFVSSLEIEDKVRFHPWQMDPYPFFAALDLLVVPSTRAGFSMAALEAMAVGTPVLLRDTGGLREIVDTDISGFLFRSDEELSEQLIELMGLPLTLESVGHGAKIRALDQFSVERVADRTLEIYERIVEG